MTQPTTATAGPVFKPAYLGDAAIGALIRFNLPAGPNGGLDTFTGVVVEFERSHHAVGSPVIRLRLDTGARVFTCAPNLHIHLAR